MAKKNKTSLVEETVENCRSDREQAQWLLTKLIYVLGQEHDKHREYGLIAAKYLETLQRSNEQMVKIALVQSKNEVVDMELSEEDREELFDSIKDEK